ncbi:multidrug efflux RND transporter permease subunit [Cronobacter muytjensii]|uniref:multidrug efflux RND transporter permease subunit n=1 Tax=Cronobacter muytjensii TaxID=413501 RepID=UPI0029DF6D18|nr:multidrug efflux RND transporter permease subunit [Cronobacter muytjensii]EKS1846110.1 multidrug efflux RND transporter permease subunit [Cronobacter muytjensii]ELY3984817.1 multidrug efflux RND transporter permease subunit [Cronobacter muytjensii]ELY4664231.1 multidrug efflux RND transporter permease subunit [Cronobacter muytjensii]ELY6276143.1 multidrug efflux RND transporter permease subunit [Cronobacter muytjensii]MEB8638497.1 multidrug efflux RND transporter permease subunit [Cronobact
MSHFFIERPVFAWVVALFIALTGLLCIPHLPVAQYPAVAPPGIIISVSYPGASPEVMNTSVVSLIEREISGVDDLLYFESSSDTTGMASITVTFKPGTDIKLAQMDLQNQIKIVEPRLPQAVRQNGINVEAVSAGFLMMVGLKSQNGQYEEADLSDYFARNITDELRRVPGVGKVQLFGGEKALRIWLDPLKLHSYGLSVTDVLTALGQQNVIVSPGRTGDEPTTPDQGVTYPITLKGQLTSVEAFANITLKSQTTGARLKLSDVARVESGLQSYAFGIRENGVPATAAAIQLSPGANAISTAAGIRARLAGLSSVLPDGMTFTVPFDTAPFVKLSIMKVVKTFVEAMILVFLVMFLFLHKIRCTLIPAIVAPMALLGTFTVMYLMGYSINILTMFGMVLAIGIIVDDAIVVVENVERLMEEKGLSPRDATHEAMREITPAIIGITLVLTAVFIPVGFTGGSVGVIYRQFSISMAVSILLSAFLALTLTPALCATLLRPQHLHKASAFSRWFNSRFDTLAALYESALGTLLKRTGRVMMLYAALCLALYAGLSALPSSFLPDEDQGYFMSSIQLPSDATMQRTLKVVQKFEQEIATRQAVESNLMILGFGFSGSGPNSAMAFTTLKAWEEREGTTAQDEADNIQSRMETASDAVTMSLLPPAISDMGTSSGFTYYLQDRGAKGYAALKQAADSLVQRASESDRLRDVYIDGLAEGTRIALDVDREKAEAMGVSFEEINQTLSVAVGSNYVNDYTNNGRVQQVIVQADAPFRMQPEQLLGLPVKNRQGQMLPLSTFVALSWNQAPQQLNRYQGYAAIRITGSAAPGISSGTAMQAIEQLAQDLPPGFAGEWAGSSLQEQASAAQLPGLIILSVMVVFMVLAALYESWSVPFAVMLVVPLGLLGAVVAVTVAAMPNDVFFKVGLITLIGLSAKNAILIIEFARQLRRAGASLPEAIMTAARQRLRPILMTSLAFTLGVVPLMLAKGASDATQHAIGTGVFGGMISGTLLAVFFVPCFYIVITRFVERRQKRQARKRAR